MSATTNKKSPVKEYRTIVDDSGDPGYVNRLLVGTPTRGTARFEWIAARYGQIIPMNWSHVVITEFINSYVPLRFPVADAQNMIVQKAIESEFEWLLLIEDDVILPPDAFIRFNNYMKGERVPIVSGLYYTKSRPSEPIIFRGRGTSFYDRFKLGDKVWADGIPTGCLLIHMGILKAMWEESPEYAYNGHIIHRVFEQPQRLWVDPESGQVNTVTGTTDLEWCTRVMSGGYFKKAGWDEFQKKKYPFLVDTNIFARHISPDGQQYP